MSVTIEQMHRWTMAVLFRVVNERNPQFSALYHPISAEAEKEGVPISVGSGYGFTHQGANEVFLTVMHQLVVAGIVVPGSHPGQPNFPFFRVSEYGKQVIETGEFLPYDPGGYFVRLKNKVPNPDKLVLRYLAESLTCLGTGCYLACAVTLGCAAEQVFNILAAGLHNSINDQSRRDQFRKRSIEQWALKKRTDSFRDEMDRVIQLASFPNDLKEDLGIQLDGIFSIIRRARNDAGHPTGKEISREDAYAHLLVFPSYYETASRLMAYFQVNRV